MKKVLLLMVCALMGFALSAQVSENFSDYTVGGKIAQQAQAMGRMYWTTWGNHPGGSEDGVVADMGGNKVGHFTYNNDQVLKLGGKTTGAWDLTFKIFIPTGKDGYFNVHANFASVQDNFAVQVGMACDPNTNEVPPSHPGQAYIYAGGEDPVIAPFAHDAWLDVKVHIDLDADHAQLYFNNVQVHQWTYTLGTFGQGCARVIDIMDIFPPSSTSRSDFYIDDIVFESDDAPIVLYETSFDDKPNGSYVAQSYPDWWTTWDNHPGTAEDGLITNEQFSTTPNSAKCAWGTDLVFKAGDKTTGAYTLDFDMYVPTNGKAFFNVLHVFNGSGSEWAVGVYFNISGGNMPQGTNVQQNNNLYPFTFPYNTWFPISIYVNLDDNVANMKINGVEILEWQYSLKESGGEGIRQLAAVDFYPPQSGSVYYIDNFVYGMEGGETFPILNILPTAIDEAGGDVITVPVNITNTGTSIGDYASWVAFDITAPSGSENFILAQCNVNSPSENGLGYPSDVLVELGVKFSGQALCDKVGTKITKMSYYLPADVRDDKLTFRIYGAYSDKKPGELLVEFVKTGGLTIGWWNEITLPEPLLIDQTELWISVEFFQENGMFPIGVDNGPLKPGCNFTRRNGGAWSEFIQSEFGNFAIKATAEGGVVPACWLSTTGNTFGSIPAGGSATFNVVLDPTTLAIGTYQGKIMIVTNDENNLLVEIPVTFAVGISTNSEMEKILVDGVAATRNGTKFTITVKDKEKVTIEAIPANNAATVSGDVGEKAVVEGKNTFNIKVTAEDGVHFTDYVLEVTNTVVAISEVDKNTIKLYPNPANDCLNITSEYAIEHITIYDLTGRVVKQIDQTTTRIDLNNISSGFYLLKVTTEQGNAMYKFVKE